MVAMKGHLGPLFLRQECKTAGKNAACCRFSVAVVQYLCFERCSLGKAFYSNAGNFNFHFLSPLQNRNVSLLEIFH